ncbi:MAG: hypothetical protein FJX56_14035 [Alphaproteobacteria bacterium]|nr:hypothetical protein [Alphaproteobacteria bacterium]
MAIPLPHGPRKAALLETLRTRIGVLERGAVPAGGVALGVPEIEAGLPGGKLPLACLHEVMGGEDGATLGFLAIVLGRLCAERAGGVLWCFARGGLSEGLYPPGLAACGGDPDRLILVRCRRPAELLWAMEEGLRCGRLVAVVGEVNAIGLAASRRLQLAAEASGVSAFLLRPAGASRPAASAARLRWRLGSLPCPAGPIGGAGCWQLELVRCRDGRPGAWVVEWNDATGALSVVAAAADRPALPRAAGMAG